MKNFLPKIAVAWALIIWSSAALPLLADVVVVSNRSLEDITCSVYATEADGVTAVGKPRTQVIVSGDLAAFPCRGPAQMAYRVGETQGAYRLEANNAYYFAPNSEEKIELHLIGLGGDARAAEGTGVGSSTLPIDAVAEIPVKVLVDDNEYSSRVVWEKRLRDRMDAASDVFEKHCRVRFKIVALEEWRSDNGVNNFPETLKEFEREVRPAPGRLAIGFTSQYPERTPGAHLGGTRGPLHPYILMRESTKEMTEAERLEVLVHELGHYLGAVHSPEPDSVMRPQLADVQARLAGFRIGFDPVNTLALNLFGDEIRLRDVANIGGLSTGTRFRLQQIYQALAQAMPEDPAPRQYLSMIVGGKTIKMEPRVSVHDGKLTGGARLVIRSLVEAAEANRKLPSAAELRDRQLAARAPAPLDNVARRSGDQLTEYYVRAAAKAALNLREEQQVSAFLVGLGVALDDSELLVRNPQTSRFYQAVESQVERKQRLAVLGQPTMRNRNDLTKHFFVSVFLTEYAGAPAADAAGLAKEMIDSTSGSGFSFVDLAADKSGVAFAQAVSKGRISLADLAENFRVADFLPTTENLPEGLNVDQFLRQIGSESDGRYQQLIDDIQGRIAALPGYQAVGRSSATP